MKKMIKGLMVVMVFVGLCGLVHLQDVNEYNKAMKRCNNQVVEHYTQQGDTYYSCTK